MYEVTVFKTDGGILNWKQPKAPTLEKLQELVGGYIETVPHLTKYEGRTHGTAYCNEEGRILGMSYNDNATKVWLKNLGDGPFRYKPEIFGPMVFYSKIKA